MLTQAFPPVGPDFSLPLNVRQPKPAGSDPIELRPYRSLADLRATILQLDAGQSDEPREVVIVLDDRSTGQLPALLARRNPGGQLTLVPLGGRLPGSFSAAASGWRRIALKHDARCAIAAASVQGRDVLVLWPAAVGH